MENESSIVHVLKSEGDFEIFFEFKVIAVNFLDDCKICFLLEDFKVVWVGNFVEAAGGGFKSCDKIEKYFVLIFSIFQWNGKFWEVR